MPRLRFSPYLLLLVLWPLLGLTSLGCSDSSGSSGSAPADESDTGEEVAAAAVQAGSGAAAVALQAALAQMDANFSGLQSPPTVTASGDASSGSLVVDFGTGTSVHNATVSGQVQATYSRTGDDATVSLAFSSLQVTNTENGTLVLSGTLTSALQISGSSATGTLTGTLALAAASGSQADTVDSVFNLTLTASAGEVVFGGSLSVESTRNGSWTVTLEALTMSVAPASRAITSGRITLTRRSGAALSVVIEITGPNTGTLTLTPPGSSQPFTF